MSSRLLRSQCRVHLRGHLRGSFYECHDKYVFSLSEGSVAAVNVSSTPESLLPSVSSGDGRRRRRKRYRQRQAARMQRRRVAVKEVITIEEGKGIKRTITLIDPSLLEFPVSP